MKPRQKNVEIIQILNLITIKICLNFISMFSFLIQSILWKVAKVGAPKAAKGLMTGVFALCRPAGSRAAAPGYKRKF